MKVVLSTPLVFNTRQTALPVVATQFFRLAGYPSVLLSFELLPLWLIAEKTLQTIGLHWQDALGEKLLRELY